MFLQEDTGTSTGAGEEAKELRGLGAATGIFDQSLKDLKKTLSGSIRNNLLNPKEITNATSKLEQLTFKLTTETLGQTRAIGEGVRNTIAEAAYESAQYGISLDDQMAVFKEINTIMQRNTLLTAEQQTNMALLARNSGVAAGDIATMVEAFDTIGVGTDEAISNISMMQQEARSYGINVGQFMKNIGSNIKLLNSYNFKNGVEGFSKMVAKAQALRIDFNKTVSLADDLLSPETAIETAAGFQMLGGAVGDLGDPFKLLYMAQNDVEGLQDSILDMAESAVSFNEKTGEFDIPVTEMYRLREAAKLTGMDYQELADTAVKSAERTKKLDLLAGSGLDDDTKELIANLGEIKDGSVKIKLPDTGELIDATQLGNEAFAGELEQLKKIQDDAQLSDREIALKQLDASTLLNEILQQQVAALGPFIGTRTDAVTSAIDSAGAAAKTMTQAVSEGINNENVDALGQAFTEAAKTGFKNEEALAVLRSRFGEVLGSLDDSFSGMGDKIKTNFSDSNIFNDGEAFKSLGDSLKQFGLDMSELESYGVGNILTGVSGDIKGFVNDLIALDMRLVQRDGQRPEEPTTQTGTPTTPITTTPTTQPTQSSTNAVENSTENTRNLETTTQANNVINGDINLNVGGTIDFAIDGRNLPQNISTEDLANAIVNSPDFTSRLLNIFTDANNTYSI